jgi:uncharacterized protein
MKVSDFIVFLSIVLTIYFLTNYYIFSRGLHALPKEGTFRTLYIVVMAVLILAYPAGRFLERILNKEISELLIHIGAYYLAMMAFALFLVLLIDLVRLGNHFIHFFPDSWYQINSKIKLISFLSVAGSVILLTIAGSWNARTPIIKKMKLKVDKTTNSFSKLNIVLASDIHLGTIIHNSKLEKIVDKINHLKPDIILLAGDVFDEDITTLIEMNTASILAKLTSKYGVYAIPGNHEYFSGIDDAIAYLQQGNITILRDSSLLVAEKFYLVGRDDRSGNRFNKTRKPLDELMNDLDKSFPVIMMDHQPFNLEEAQNNGVDLQVSGHTHHGQFFPFNLITNRVYELSWGYKQKGATHYYVSCGVGTWGPPVRLGNRPEIVNIELEFSSN